MSKLINLPKCQKQPSSLLEGEIPEGKDSIIKNKDEFLTLINKITKNVFLSPKRDGVIIQARTLSKNFKNKWQFIEKQHFIGREYLLGLSSELAEKYILLQTTKLEIELSSKCGYMSSKSQNLNKTKFPLLVPIEKLDKV